MTDPTAASADLLLVADEEIPIPPREMWDELDNSDEARTTAAPAPAPAPAAESAPKQMGPTVAALEFVGDELPFRRVPLRFPFRFDGVEHREVVVHRLTVAQMGAFWDSLPEDGDYDRIDVYALMTALPPAVLRALPDPDGPAVTGACFDFLPRALAGGRD